MSAAERLIRYCKVDTQSDPNHSEVTPSSQKQFDLAKILEAELKEAGLEGVVLDEHGYVYGHLKSNLDHPCKTVGFIAHMDTAPDFSGKEVHPRIIEHYDGKDIPLSDTMVTKVSDFPQLKNYVGMDLIVTDGTTLLGADDKAGVAIIMETMFYYQAHPEVKHGPISVAFTPDEEIGNGTNYFDVKAFAADFAYTLDGDDINGYCEETFSASAAKITFHGFSIHPGSAKNRMINAIAVASSLHSLLPSAMTPEHTEGYEGFIHLTDMKGDVVEAESEYILRDHDNDRLAQKEELLRQAVAYINSLYGNEVATLTIREQYRNMRYILDTHPEIASVAFRAMEQCGLHPFKEPARGGTDGCQLTYKGLLCPNLGTGGGNFHGPYEYCVIQQLEKQVEVIRTIATIVSEEA